MADKRRPPYSFDRTEPSLPPWQSAARPGPVFQPGAKPAKPRKARGAGPDERNDRVPARRRAPLHSKPLKLASARKRGVFDWIVGVVRVCIVAILLLLPLLLAGSAPVGPLPDVQTRFEDWRQAHNESAVDPLPRRDAGP